MVIPRNNICGQIERFPNMIHKRRRNLAERGEVTQTRKELDRSRMRFNWFCAVRVMVLAKRRSSAVGV